MKSAWKAARIPTAGAPSPGTKRLGTIDLRSFFQAAFALRKEHPALRDGEWKLLHAAEASLCICVLYSMISVVVVLNNSSQHVPPGCAVRVPILPADNLFNARGYTGFVSSRKSIAYQAWWFLPSAGQHW